jgi:ATP-dependent Clp protease ATP-binding subunit ClpC
MKAFFGGQDDFDGAVEIEKVGTNLNLSYPTQLKRAFQREDMVRQLYHTIYQQDNTPVVLVGEEGVGKHSLVHEVVYRYNENWTSPQTEKMPIVWHVDPTRIIAGMSVVGMWQKRFEAILQHLMKRLSGTTDKILIDNVVAMLRIGKSAQNSMTLSDVLKPYLEKRQLQLIIAATAEEWKIIQEKDRRFADLFQVIRVQAPTEEVAVKMVLEERKLLELRHGCHISIPAIRQLFTIHRNYFKQKALPGSVCKLLNQLAVKYSMQKIDVDQVQTEFAQYSGLSTHIFDDNYVFEEGEVHETIAASIIGQPQAVKCLTDVIHTIKSKLSPVNKPLGSFLFIGPTGVGKTEAAKTICRYLLGDTKKLMRFDMNEYIDEAALSRLVGDYYNPEGQLTGKVRYNPFGIVLFDEIEKAHPKIHDLLLQVLDDGRLTDSLGRTVDFSNVIIIMTSNIGAAEADNQLGFETKGSSDDAIYQKAVENFFRPEFINRIDQTIIFDALELDHILSIAKLQIQNLLSRDGFVRRTTILNISEDALQWVAERGFNAKMGGRALKRQIEKDLTAFSADQLVKTTSDQPLIFDIRLKDGVLAPQIEVLDFVDPYPEGWMPKVPSERQLKRAYGDLIRNIEEIEMRIRQYDDENEAAVIDTIGNDQLNWELYDLKNQLVEKKEHANRMLLGFRSKYFDHIVSSSLRLKSAGTSSIIFKRDTNKIEKILLKQQLFQKSALDELRYVYQNAPEQFDRQQSLYLTDYCDLNLIQLKVDDLLTGESQKIRLRIDSMIKGQGRAEIGFLKELYQTVFEDLAIHYELKDDVFEIEGAGVAMILEAERGYHLFYRAHHNPLPIRVQIESIEENNELSGTNPVIRLYDISLGKKHKSSTITDLRTGFTNQANITSQEFKLFWFAFLNMKNKNEIASH